MVTFSGSVISVVIPPGFELKLDKLQFGTKTMLGAVFIVGTMLTAYSRGHYLLGWQVGAFYSLFTFLLLTQGTRYFFQSPLPKLRIAILAITCIPLACVMAFPSYFVPNAGYLINDHRTDQDGRTELAAVFASDPAFKQIQVTTFRTRIVGFKISGKIPTKNDLKRLRTLIHDCENTNYVSWNIYVIDESKTYNELKDSDFDPGN